MSKELEYIQGHIKIVRQQVNRSQVRFLITDPVKKTSYDFYENELQTLESIENALQRLEAIENANPNEALRMLDQFINEMTRCLENPKEYIKGYEKQIFWKYKNTFETTIKQALLKQQEQENIFDDMLGFNDGSIMSCFEYKGKQIVTMPLEKYDEFMKQEKAQEPKHYLKWEDLEFTKDLKCQKVKMNDNDYRVRYTLDDFGGKCCFLYDSARNHYIVLNKQFFNDLRLERVEE